MGNSRKLYRLIKNTDPRNLNVGKVTNKSDGQMIHLHEDHLLTGAEYEWWIGEFARLSKWQAVRQ